MFTFFFNIFIVIFASSKFVPICINKTDTAESFGPDNLIGGLKEALVSMEQPDIGISLLAPWQSPQPARAQNQNFKPHQWTQYTGGGDRPCWEFRFKSCVVIARKVVFVGSLIPSCTLHIE